MFWIVPHGGRQMFLSVDPKRLCASTTISRPRIPVFTRAFLPFEHLKHKDKWRPRGCWHSDAQVKLRARKHQNCKRKAFVSLCVLSGANE